MIRSRASRLSSVAITLACACWGADSSVAAEEDRPRWNDVPMSRIHPFPSKKELGRRISRVQVVAKAGQGVPKEQAGAGKRELQKQLSEQIRESGAKTVSKGAAHAVVAELLDYEYEAEFKAPTNWLFKSEEEMAAKPGKCEHEVELELSIDVYEGGRKQPIRAWSLEAWGQTETRTADRSCPFGSAERQKLVVQALRESMPCMQVELMNLFAPRGHVVAHRRFGERGTDVFRTTIERDTLPEGVMSFSVNRVQLSTDPEGERRRDEYEIARGRMAEQPGEAVWIELKASKATLPLLAGDVARPIIDRGVVSKMNPFGGCDEILEER